MLDGQRGQLVGIPPDQDRFDHDPVTACEPDAAVVADGQDRPDQMLAVAHPAGYPVHDHSNRALCHIVSSVSPVVVPSDTKALSKSL